MVREGKKCYNWFLRPCRFIGRRRSKLVPEVINPPMVPEVINPPMVPQVINPPMVPQVINPPMVPQVMEELREEGPLCGPVFIPHQHFHNTLRHSVAELVIVGSTHGEPISVPGIILIVKHDLIGILFGGNLIREGNDYRVRLPNMVETKEVQFGDFVIKELNDYGQARLALLAYRPEEVVQPCYQIELGMNCSRNELLYLYDFRLCENIEGKSEVYESALNDGPVVISEHSTFIVDCTPVSHSYYGGLLFDPAGRLIGIAFDKIGPILAFQVSFIESALMEINPEAESIEDCFLNVRRIDLPLTFFS